MKPIQRVSMILLKYAPNDSGISDVMTCNCIIMWS